MKVIALNKRAFILIRTLHNMHKICKPMPLQFVCHGADLLHNEGKALTRPATHHRSPPPHRPAVVTPVEVGPTDLQSPVPAMPPILPLPSDHIASQRLRLRLYSRTTRLPRTYYPGLEPWRNCNQGRVGAHEFFMEPCHGALQGTTVAPCVTTATAPAARGTPRTAGVG